jgi:hypothetical protein
MKITKQGYPDLERLKQRLEKEVRKLESQLGEATKQLFAVNTTLSLLTGKNVYVTFTSPEANISPNDLSGLTMLEAMAKIARANSNRLKLTTAKDLLVRAGVTKSPKNANNIIATTIKRSGMFRKVGRGEYELVESSDSPAGEVIAAASIQ